LEYPLVPTENDIYNLIGEEGFAALVRAFYAQVETDDLLKPMYPADDIEGAQLRLKEFLIQRFGGPARYSESRGHPRLRMRHAVFRIGQAEADRWLELMKHATLEAKLTPQVVSVMWPYFVQTAQFMINRVP